MRLRFFQPPNQKELRMRYVGEHAAHEQFDDFLDEANPVVEILGMSYNLSTVLKKCDPIAYRCAFNDWCAGENITID